MDKNKNKNWTNTVIDKYKKPFGWALLVFFLGGFGGLVVQKYVAPWLAAKPVFSSLGFLRVNSPIVITKTEQIRVNENISLVDLVKQLTPKTVLVLGGRGKPGENFEERLRGGGVIVSSDGVIATDASLFANTGNNYLVVTADGKVLPATFLTRDTKTNLALIKVENGDFSTVNFGQTSELQLAQQLVVLTGSEGSNVSHLRLSYVTRSVADVSTNTVYSSEGYAQNFGIDVQAPLGSGVFNLFGQLVGLATNDSLIPGEAVRSAVESYFRESEISRPYLGVNYSLITSSGAKILGLPVETGVVLNNAPGRPAVRPDSPAEAAGLVRGDIITGINGEAVNLNQTLDFYLNRAKPGDEWRLKVLRDGEEMELTLTLGEL